MKWPTAPLGDLCNVISGGTPKRSADEYWNGDIAWVKISDMLQGEITSTDECITELGLSESPARLLEPGTLLLSIFATVGRTAILTIPAATNQAIVGLQLKADTLDQSYLRHFLDSQTAALKQKSRGVAQDNINTSILKQLQIPLPPLEEQRRIAAILDKADSIKHRLAQRHRLMDSMIGSMLLNDFGSPPEWPSKWKIQKLGDCCDCLDRFRKPVKESDRKEGNIPYYGANGQQGWIDDFLFNESLVLVAEDGGHFHDKSRGVAYRIDGKSWVNNHAHILKPRSDDIEVEFLHRVLRHYDFVPYISGSTRSKLTQGQLNEVPIPVPPITIQRSFSNRVERLSSSLELAARSLVNADLLVNSLGRQYLGCAR
jgi:type I restriction enzyme S subunit